jgi:hypothetical protein
MIELKGVTKMLKHILLAIAAAAMLTTSGQVLAADETPSGTIVIDETQVMALIGGSMGGGTLHMGDESHSFQTGGLSLGASVGVHKIHITGNVYHLDKVKKFAGTYIAAEASATLIKGVGGLWLENKHGVILHLTSNNQGLALSLAAEGLKITME